MVGHGAVGFCLTDGLTVYWDVYGEDVVASGFYGLDYGHSQFVELRAQTEEGLRTLRGQVEMAFADAFECEEGEHRIGKRGVAT